MPDQIGPSDLSKMLSLIVEYTSKLRDVCVFYSQSRARRFQLLASVTAASIFLSAAFYFVPPLFVYRTMNASDASFNLAITQIFSFVALALPLTMLFLFLIAAPRRGAYDAHHLAKIVERLVRTASQYNEHAAQRISETFEFELRLAEAEASLKMYEDTFHRTGLIRFLP